MESDMSHNNSMSNHGLKRNQQRGVKKQYMNLLISFADREIPVRNGCISLSVSKTRLKSLVNEGRLDAQMAEKMKNLVVVAANDDAEPKIVTVLHAEPDKRGRHYRKNVKFRRNRSRKQQREFW